MMTTNSAVNIKPRGELRVDASQCPNIRLEVNSCPSEKSSHVRRKVKVTMHQKRGTKEKCNIVEEVRRENSVSTSSLQSIKLNQTLGVLEKDKIVNAFLEGCNRCGKSTFFWSKFYLVKKPISGRRNSVLLVSCTHFFFTLHLIVLPTKTGLVNKGCHCQLSNNGTLRKKCSYLH